MTSLALLRHAKSAWPPGVPDLLRPLNERGLRDAPAAGRLLAGREPLELALVSPANRTRATWEAVAAELDSPPTAGLDPRIYEAEVEDLLDVLAGVPAGVKRVIMVSHNPGTELLASYLCAEEDSEAYRAMVTRYPTCGLAELTWSGGWQDLPAGQAQLMSFEVPRG